MPGGYTEAQWNGLLELFEQNEPKAPKDREIAKSKRITAVTIAAGEAGMLLNVELNRAKTRFIYLSAAAALSLARDISAAGDERGWWKEGLAYQRNPALVFPTSNDANDADFVASLLTVVAPDGLFVKFVLGKETVTYAMTKNIAMEIMLAAKAAADRHKWLGQ